MIRDYENPLVSLIEWVGFNGFVFVKDRVMGPLPNVSNGRTLWLK